MNSWSCSHRKYTSVSPKCDFFSSQKCGLLLQISRIQGLFSVIYDKRPFRRAFDSKSPNCRDFCVRILAPRPLGSVRQCAATARSSLSSSPVTDLRGFSVYSDHPATLGHNTKQTGLFSVCPSTNVTCSNVLQPQLVVSTSLGYLLIQFYCDLFKK